jgi:hypothetical protein
MTTVRQPGQSAGASGGGGQALVLDEPVFVLTGARSGSTLLRMILDAHPELACPPETNIAKIWAQLWDVWTLLDPECTKPALSGRARANIRAMTDSAFEGYLASRGKSRWCDKSLGTAEVADKVLQVYEKAKFICLYRHVMDVVNSGVEASPWGLHGYGFDRHVRPGLNTVSTLVGYWVDSAVSAIEFEAAHPEKCLRVYYEELVTEPEQVAAQIFDFIGVAPAPGITQYALLDQEKAETFGHGDHKIWSSKGVSSGSVGRGIRVPPTLIPPNQATGLNQVLETLGYAQVNRAWQMSACPPPLLARPTVAAPPQDAVPAQDLVLADDHPLVVRSVALDCELTDRVTRNLKKLSATLQRWDAVGIVAYSVAPRAAQAWRIDLSARELQSDQEVDFQALDVDWLFAGEIETWMSLLRDDGNIASALRNGHVRYIGKEMADGAPPPESTRDEDLRVRMITHLLELGSQGLD